MEIPEVSQILGNIGRKYRKSLLVVSSISLAYKILGLRITGFSAAGSEGKIGNPELIPWVLLAITVYFLVFFIWHAKIDTIKENKNTLIDKFNEEIKGIPALLAAQSKLRDTQTPFDSDINNRVEDMNKKIRSNRRFLYIFEVWLPAIYAICSMVVIMLP